MSSLPRMVLPVALLVPYGPLIRVGDLLAYMEHQAQQARLRARIDLFRRVCHPVVIRVWEMIRSSIVKEEDRHPFDGKDFVVGAGGRIGSQDDVQPQVGVRGSDPTHGRGEVRIVSAFDEGRIALEKAANSMKRCMR
jgi:hypothetical protein